MCGFFQDEREKQEYQGSRRTKDYRKREGGAIFREGQQQVGTVLICWLGATGAPIKRNESQLAFSLVAITAMVSSVTVISHVSSKNHVQSHQCVKFSSRRHERMLFFRVIQHGLRPCTSKQEPHLA